MLVSRRFDDTRWGWSSEDGPLASLVWEVLPWGLEKVDSSWWYPTAPLPRMETQEGKVRFLPGAFDEPLTRRMRVKPLSEEQNARCNHTP